MNHDIYNTCRQGIICCPKMDGLLYISNVAQAMVGQTEGGKEAVSTFLAVAVPSPKYHCLSAPH